jgi:hypothetical protein
VDLRFDVLQSTELVARGSADKIAHAPTMAGRAPYGGGELCWRWRF